jgi:hypothetical protein
VTSFDRAARNPLFKSRPKIFGVGGALRPKGSTNLYRFVKWPRYVKLQRQKQVLLNRIKVPPAINQFRHTLEKNHSTELFRLLNKYKPESPQDKKKRLLEEAKVGMASVKSVSHSSYCCNGRPAPGARRFPRASRLLSSTVCRM